MDKKALAKLREIRERFSLEYIFFPLDCCEIASKIIETKLGFARMRGRFVDTINNYREPHCWNVTPDGEIVDITADQFDEKIPEIYVLNGDSPEAKKRYFQFDSATGRIIPND